MVNLGRHIKRTNTHFFAFNRFRQATVDAQGTEEFEGRRLGLTVLAIDVQRSTVNS